MPTCDPDEAGLCPVCTEYIHEHSLPYCDGEQTECPLCDTLLCVVMEGESVFFEVAE